MTPTTPNQAREAADLYRATGIPVSVTVVYSLADQNEKLTKERDILRYELDAIPGIKEERDDAWLQNTQLDTRCAKLEIERDFLAMANKDLSEAMNRYQELQQAAKLALEALEVATTPLATDRQEVLEAITALRQAGVQ